MRAAVKRRPLTLAAVASLLLCIATVVLWVRSYWVEDVLLYAREKHALAYILHCRSGALTGGRIPSFESPPQARFEHRATSTSLGETPMPVDEWFLGIGWFSMDFSPVVNPNTPGRHLYLVKVPIWMVFLVSLPLPAIWMVRRSVSRSDTRRCDTCGYDLRATPDRCPECGGAAARQRGGAAATAAAR
jgi:hypothetical protein